jgi:alkanesulfonate monooxygenase SsuD/methylene tetrahydromethanopterin reductase-like flavin-dependent oxidoreductase (luciferase family)
VRIGYLIDLHKGGWDPPVPARADAVATMEAMIEEGKTAERYGFHSVSVPDRHGRTECYFPGPLQLLTILARETERVAIGAFALVSTLYHPMLVAEQTAVIDNLSRGRLFMAFGRGYHPAYWDYFGVPTERLLGRFLESVEVIRRAYQGRRFTYDGEFYQVRDAILSPQPYQEGGYPIWGAGTLAPAIRRCAEYAESWTCAPNPLREDRWEEQAGAYRKRARELGKQPFIVLMRDGWVGKSFEAARTEFGDHWIDEKRFKSQFDSRYGIHEHDPDYDINPKLTPQSVHKHMLVGSPAQVIEEIEMYREVFGVDYIQLRVRMPGGPSLEAAREQIQRFGEDVVGPIHRKYPEPLTHPAIPQATRW